MPKPNHPKLPLCCQLAAQPDRYLFASNLVTMLMDQLEDARQADARRLNGMLIAYMEMDVISTDDFAAMADELTAFTFGAEA